MPISGTRKTLAATPDTLHAYAGGNAAPYVGVSNPGMALHPERSEPLNTSSPAFRAALDAALAAEFGDWQQAPNTVSRAEYCHDVAAHRSVFQQRRCERRTQ